MSNTETAPSQSQVYPENLKKAIADLIALQARTGKSAELFAHDHLSYSSTVWSKVQNGTYSVKEFGTLATQLTADARRLNEELALASRGGNNEYYPLDHHEAILKGIRQCRTKQNENRLCVYLAPTGGGKTTIAQKARKEFNGLLVRVAESWRHSYMAPLKATSIAAGGNGQFRSEYEGETELRRVLCAKKWVLAIDEGETFGPRTVNFIKFILNETPTTILLCTIEQLYDSWNKAAWIQAQQLKRRTHLVVRCPLITPADVSWFLPKALTFDTPALKPACIEIARAANQFGKYDLITRIASDLLNQGPDVITLEDAQKSVAKVQRYISFSN